MAKRYQRGNQNPQIKEEQTNQWPKDTNNNYLTKFVFILCWFYLSSQIVLTG
jgi:hypothetical protein